VTDFLAALGLVFVIEGLVLAAFPDATRQAAAVMTQAPGQALRWIGVASAVFGLAMLWVVRS
jgi:hypothetical protein